MANKLYNGIFNYQGEKHDEWVRAASEAQAFRLLTARLGTKLNTTAYAVRQYFNGREQSYTIREEKEDGK